MDEDIDLMRKKKTREIAITLEDGVIRTIIHHMLPESRRSNFPGSTALT